MVEYGQDFEISIRWNLTALLCAVVDKPVSAMRDNVTYDLTIRRAWASMSTFDYLKKHLHLQIGLKSQHSVGNTWIPPQAVALDNQVTWVWVLIEVYKQKQLISLNIQQTLIVLFLDVFR